MSWLPKEEKPPVVIYQKDQKPKPKRAPSKPSSDWLERCVAAVMLSVIVFFILMYFRPPFAYKRDPRRGIVHTSSFSRHITWAVGISATYLILPPVVRLITE